MDKIIIILNEGPSTSRAWRSWNAIRIANTLVDVNLEITMILLDESVYCARKDREPSKDLQGLDLDRKLSDLIKVGIKVLVCGSCCEARGLKKEELIDNIELCCLMDVANAIKASKQTLVF